MILLKMWAILLPILLLQLLNTPTVYAGHPEWEHARFMLPNWVSVKPVEPWSRLWPDKTIKLCYESEATWRKYHNYYRSAMRLWYASGLPEEFKVREVGRDACQNTPHEQLMVIDTPELFATDIGFPSNDYLNPSNHPSPNKPAMYVCLYHRDTEEFRVTTFAHELAHSFGMYHEHQNPYYWLYGSQVFTFHCNQMKDFEELTNGMSQDRIWGADGVCRSFTQARNIGFPSIDWLPVPFDEIMSPHGSWANKASVDFDSIMLYGSHNGGETEFSVTLSLADGTLFDEPETPSVDDVMGLKLLYNTVYGTPVRILFNDPRSPNYSTFRTYAGCFT
ncbi:lysM domain-containing protein [Aspergillus niger]|uniref:Uncharacterized protein n=5 Tax=Aspergillus niger TaxID=5061 RepID=A2R4L5_ASPNC|nr:hypothetical protein An15g00830 [Aspergillus niger]RDH22607.1 hypothetical protein M747DRAFT_339580 [Aspergillus niger ATCC 13496]GJP89210.1 lysM domain-containing protein [Aspergillus niger]CAK42253.1 hypothetical protein An15g00830 [Aspergillus niger]|eukprot:XP_001396623.1 hypothetical protein ANI_1_1140134 [Aspergillus niger CBS 513.88]